MWKLQSMKGLAAIASISIFLQACETSTPKAVVQDGSITDGKIADGAITSRTIKAGAVTADKLDPALALSGVSGTFSGNLSVGGTSILTGGVTASAAMTVGTTLGVTGASTFSNTITQSHTDATAAGTQLIANSFLLNTGVASTTARFATRSKVLTTSNVAITQLVGSYGLAQNDAVTAGTTIAELRGAAGEAMNNATGTITVSRGAKGLSSNITTGSVGTGVGVEGEVSNSSTGTVTLGIGVQGSVTAGAAGSVYTTARAFSSNPTLLAGVATYEGLFLADPAGGAATALAATRYGIVSDGAAAVNWFAGNVGIGAGKTNPSVALDVTGAASFSTNLTAAGTVTFSGIGTGGSAGDAICAVVATGVISKSGTGVCTNPSDRRLKENIKIIPNALEKITQLNGVSFDWIDKKEHGSQHELGVIAQEVEKVFPEIVRKNERGFLGITYISLIGPLIESVKELYSKWQVDHKLLNQDNIRLGQIEKKIEIENLALKAENKALKERLDKIELALAQAAPSKAITGKGRKVASKALLK